MLVLNEMVLVVIVVVVAESPAQSISSTAPSLVVDRSDDTVTNCRIYYGSRSFFRQALDSPLSLSLFLRFIKTALGNVAGVATG